VQRQPVFNIPASVAAIVAALVAIHALRLYVATEGLDDWIVSTFAFVPGRATYAFDPAGVLAHLPRLPGQLATERLAIARYFLGNGSLQWWTPLTYAALHADWAHCGMNCVWLVAFGSPVARRIGGLRFLALCVATAIAGAAAQWALHRFDLVPVIGASAAVSGAMAAAARFIFQPGAPLGLGLRDSETVRQPAMPLAKVFTDARALPFLLAWLGVNLLFGLISQPLGMTSGPVAWEAHVGGFLAGLLLFPLFDRTGEASPKV